MQFTCGVLIQSTQPKANASMTEFYERPNDTACGACHISSRNRELSSLRRFRSTKLVRSVRLSEQAHLGIDPK